MKDESGGFRRSSFVVRRSRPMHSPDPARGEDPDAGPVRGPRGGRDGGRAVQLARHDDRQIAAAHLADALRRRQVLDLAAIQPDDDLAGDDADGGRGRAARADDLLQAQGELDVVRIGQPVRDHGGFQRDRGVCQVVGNVHEIGKS